MSRQDEDAHRRVPFYLYMDEFHHFVTPSIAAILSGARKYGLGLLLSHQEVRQLKNRSEEVLSAVLGNVYTRVVFRVGEQDAKMLADGFSFFEPTDLQNLGVGEAIARVERPDFDFNLKTVPVPKVDERIASQRRNAARDLSRSQFATPRAEIDSALREDREVTLGSEAPMEPRPKQRSERTATSAPASSPQPGTAALPGRGGPQHKYLQSLVKKLAEDRGFAVSLEKTVLDGHGHVDAFLERDALRIGCEISVSTRFDHELGNLTKCLAAGFDYAILLAVDERILVKARQDLAVAEERLRFMAPEALIAFLDEFDAPVQARPSVPKGKESQSAKTSMPAGETKRMLIARDAAAYVGLATQTLAKLRVTGDSPPYYKVGRQVLYDRDDLDAWLNSRRGRSTSDGTKLAPRDV
jgi:predicted DNA-binding transcriptional regulator AlpA